MNDLRILLRDPAFVVIFTIMPLAFMAFTKGAFSAGLTAEYPGRTFNGAEQVVPGSAVLFSGFLVGNLGFAIFREHSWATWDRLRASQLNTAELMLGKAIGPVIVLAIQLSVMLGGGALLFGLHLRGSLAAFLLVAVALALMEVSLGFMLLAICRSVLQLNAATNLGAMMLSGIGGAVTPIYLLPTWAQSIAPATPAYWAMQGFTDVTIHGGGLADVAKPVTVLLAYSVAFVAIAAWRFRTEDAKVGWA
jgi:ABC-2 type transport system permease protein